LTGGAALIKINDNRFTSGLLHAESQPGPPHRRREQILLAACKCFSKKGFTDHHRDICREAGLSAGAVYAYFKSKDDILEGIAENGASEHPRAARVCPQRRLGSRSARPGARTAIERSMQTKARKARA